MTDDPGQGDPKTEDTSRAGIALEQTDILPPTTMLSEKYRLGRLIGEGGMGAVYEAEHTGLGIKVAIKLLNEVFASDHKALSRFDREAKATAAIRHANIVEVTDTGKDNEGIPFLVMELLEGESLSALLRREKVLAPHLAVVIASQILAGLAAAHGKEVIHRDLKPGNILLARNNEGGYQVKILDFGISKFRSNLVQDVTAAGAVVGTPRFMAPEQAIGQPDLDARVDLYAVGVLLYRMVSGRLPFTSRTHEGVIQQILEGVKVKPREVRADVPVALEETILKAMEPNRERRFSDARAFMAALHEATPEFNTGTLNFTLPTMTATPPGGASPTGLSHSVSIASGSIPSAMYAGHPSTGATTQPSPAVTPSVAGESMAPQSRPRWILPLILAVAVGGGLGLFFRFRTVPPPKKVVAAADAGAKKGVGPTAQKYAGAVIRVGITRYLPRGQLATEHRRLVKHLTEQIKRPVQLKIHEDYVDMSAQLTTGKLDLAALSSYSYVRSKRKHPGIRLIATHETKSGRTYEGVVVALKSQKEIRSLKDFKGKRFCYVNPTSTSGYLYPRALFRRINMDPDTIFKTTRFTGDHLAALKALESGACDGAAVFRGIFFEAQQHGLNPQRYAWLATTDPIPYDAYCLSPRLPADVAEMLSKALLSLRPNSEITRKVLGEKSRIVGFVPVKDSDYDSVRKIERYLDSPTPRKK